MFVYIPVVLNRNYPCLHLFSTCDQLICTKHMQHRCHVTQSTIWPPQTNTVRTWRPHLQLIHCSALLPRTVRTCIHTFLNVRQLATKEILFFPVLSISIYICGTFRFRGLSSLHAWAGEGVCSEYIRFEFTSGSAPSWLDAHQLVATSASSSSSAESASSSATGRRTITQSQLEGLRQAGVILWILFHPKTFVKLYKNC